MLQAVATKSKRVTYNKCDLFIQCQWCKDYFTVAGSVRKQLVYSLEPHPHIISSNGTRGPKSYRCHCGGWLKFFL